MRMFSTPWTPSGVLHNDSADCLLPSLHLCVTCQSEAHQCDRENSCRARGWAGHEVPRDMNGAWDSARRWFTGQRHMTWFTGQRHMTWFTGQRHMTRFTGQRHMTRFTGQGHMTWFAGQGHMTWFTGQTITGSGWKHCSQNCADTSLSHSKPSTVCSFSFAFTGTCCGIYKAQDCGLHSIPSGRSARAAHKEKHAGEFISPSASVLRDSNTSHQHPALHATKAPTAPAQFQPRGAHSRHHSPNDVTTLVNCSKHSEQATTNHPWIVIYPTSLAEVCQSLKAYHFCAHSP